MLKVTERVNRFSEAKRFTTSLSYLSTDQGCQSGDCDCFTEKATIVLVGVKNVSSVYLPPSQDHLGSLVIANNPTALTMLACRGQ